MNYTGITKSNYVEVSDKEQLQDLIAHAKMEWDVAVQTYWSDGLFALGYNGDTMYVPNNHLDDFLTILGDCIEEPMIIRSVGFEGMRYLPHAWQWTVFPDGEWVRDSLWGLSG